MHIDLLLPQLPTHCKISSSLLRKHLTAFSKILFHSALLMVKIRHCLHNKQSLKPIPNLSTQRRLPAYLSGASTRSTTTCPSATKSKATRRGPSKKSRSRTTNSFLLPLRPSSLNSSAIATTSTHLTTPTRNHRQTSLLSFFTTSSSTATLPPLPVPPEPPPWPTYPLCDLPNLMQYSITDSWHPYNWTFRPQLAMKLAEMHIQDLRMAGSSLDSQ